MHKNLRGHVIMITSINTRNIIVLFAMLLTISDVARGQYIRYSDDGKEPKQVKNGVISTSNPFVRVYFSANEDIFYPPYDIIHRNDTIFLCRETVTRKDWVLSLPTSGTTYFYVKDARGSQRMVKIVRSSSVWPYAFFALGMLALGVVALIILHMRKKYQARHASDLLLKASQKHTKKYECVTVLFADIQGFTKIAEHMNPDQLVDELDRYFIFFDELAERFGVEKIKTIGDAYMCAGGVPEDDSANPIEVALVGLGMIDYVKERRLQDKGFWNIRVGLNTGPVISGNLGHKKRVFDIWGDSVNTASRMESSSEPGEVNVSDNTYVKIRDYFDCEHRGRMPVKYKGEIDMYFVKRLKPMYAEPGSIYKPNEAMMLKIQILKTTDVEEDLRRDVIRKYGPALETRFNMLLQRVELLARASHLTDQDYVVCRVAAMLMFIQTEFAKEYKADAAIFSDKLARLRLDEEQTEMMLRTTTNIVQQSAPQGVIEQIIHDARYDYLSRKSLGAILLQWYDAEADRNKHLSRKEWFNSHKALLDSVVYYTDTERKLAEVHFAAQKEIIDVLLAS